MTCTAERASAPCCTGQAFLPGCECGSAERDPGVGDVVAGARLGEGLQGAGGEFLRAAGVAVAQQELCARLPYLRAFQGFAETFRELFGLGEVALGFVAVACAEPRSCPARAGSARRRARRRPRGAAGALHGGGARLRPIRAWSRRQCRGWRGSCCGSRGRGRLRAGPPGVPARHGIGSRRPRMSPPKYSVAATMP